MILLKGKSNTFQCKRNLPMKLQREDMLIVTVYYADDVTAPVANQETNNQASLTMLFGARVINLLSLVTGYNNIIFCCVYSSRIVYAMSNAASSLYKNRL